MKPEGHSLETPAQEGNCQDNYRHGLCSFITQDEMSFRGVNVLRKVKGSYLVNIIDDYSS